MNMNVEDSIYVKEAKAENLYKLQNNRGWEIYFRPLKDDNIEVICFFQGDPHCNPRKIGDTHTGDTTKDNVEVWSITEARDAWGAWVEHSKFERAEVEDFLRGGRSEWAGENFNYRKESKSASWCIPEE